MPESGVTVLCSLPKLGAGAIRMVNDGRDVPGTKPRRAHSVAHHTSVQFPAGNASTDEARGFGLCFVSISDSCATDFCRNFDLTDD